MRVGEVQAAFRELGFIPGGAVDGIYGYRTQSVIRHFQEYVPSVEGLDSLPDGRAGPGTQRHLQRWRDGGLQTTWSPTIANWKAGFVSDEYGAWLELLRTVQAKAPAIPRRGLQLVNAWGAGADTRRVADWDFSPRQVQLVGIRRAEASGTFDDIVVLLLDGLTFKFQGSTETGASTHPKGRPFLVRGQYDSHFGWHQRKYFALRPVALGVLAMRSGHDTTFDDSDPARGLEANTSIDIHWSGRGMKADIKSWSEGCQVIIGSVCLDSGNRLVHCAGFAAMNNGEVTSTPTCARVGYNVLLDLVTALGSDLPPTVKYTLLAADDLALAPSLGEGVTLERTQMAALLS